MSMDFIKIKNLGMRGRYFLLAILFAAVSLLGNIPNSKVYAAVGTVTEYNIPTSGVNPWYLTSGPDNKIWYTGYSSTSSFGKLSTAGAITEYSGPTSGMTQMGITAGSDGNMWYSTKGTIGGSLVGQIVKVSTSGAVLGTYTIPGNRIAYDMSLGPDGNVWFNENGDQKIGKITPMGSITEYSVSVPYGAGLMGITAGPDGNMWFIMQGSGMNNAIGQMTTSGSYTLYPLSISGARPFDITAGPDGNMWFTENGAKKIGKITMSGTITEYSVSVKPYGITAGPDGNLWYTNDKIGRITTSGTITEYSVPTSLSPHEITAGPDNAVWFVNANAGKIGRVVATLINQTTSFTSVAPTDAIISGPTYNPTALATSGLPVAITVDSSSSGVCSIVSGVVSFQQAGICTLNANQGGDANYSSAPQVQQTFTVAPVDADSSVVLSCPTTALVGTSVTCTITVSNAGPAASASASLTALFSNSFTGTSLSGGGTLSGQSITWTTPSLVSGDSATFTFSGTASLASKTSFSAALLQMNPDPVITNNIANATIVIS